MRGHITKRGKDSYTIVLDLGRDPSTGKRKQQWLSVKGTKKEAEKKLSELLTQLDAGVYIKPSNTSLAAYLERWMKDYVQPNLSPRTAEGYNTIVTQHLIPKLGKITLTQLRPEHLQKYYSEMLERGCVDKTGGLSAQTVRHHHTALHKALQTAVEWGLLSRNVADAVKPPRTQRPEMQVWSEDEITQFLEYSKKTPYHALFYVALFTGMRRSEMLALRWQDVDLMLGHIAINRTIHQLKDLSYIFRPPKTAKGRRTVALTPSTIKVLKEHREKQWLNYAMIGKPVSEEDFVFATIEGKPLRPNTITHAWTTIAQHAGVKQIRLHDARHSHASLMLKQGIHPKIVQERLGHASISVTLDTYSHIAPGLQEAAAAAFDQAFTKPYNDDVNDSVG